jgi:hypothetical protein
MLEKKVLFLSNNLELLTIISESFISLLYPFKWNNTYIPIINFEIIEFL